MLEPTGLGWGMGVVKGSNDDMACFNLSLEACVRVDGDSGMAYFEMVAPNMLS